MTPEQGMSAKREIHASAYKEKIKRNISYEKRDKERRMFLLQLKHCLLSHFRNETRSGLSFLLFYYSNLSDTRSCKHKRK